MGARATIEIERCLAQANARVDRLIISQVVRVVVLRWALLARRVLASCLCNLTIGSTTLLLLSTWSHLRPLSSDFRSYRYFSSQISGPRPRETTGNNILDMLRREKPNARLASRHRSLRAREAKSESRFGFAYFSTHKAQRHTIFCIYTDQSILHTSWYRLVGLGLAPIRIHAASSPTPTAFGDPVALFDGVRVLHVLHSPLHLHHANGDGDGNPFDRRFRRWVGRGLPSARAGSSRVGGDDPWWREHGGPGRRRRRQRGAGGAAGGGAQAPLPRQHAREAVDDHRGT